MGNQKTENGMARAPEGFHRVGSVANAGWFNMKKIGNTIQGKLVGMFDRKDDLNPAKRSDFFQIQVSSECEVRLGRGEDAELVMVKAGDYVNLNDGPKTKDLRKCLPELSRGAEFEVWGSVLGEKIKLQGGRSMHNFDLFIKQTKAPEIVAASEPDFDNAADDAQA